MAAPTNILQNVQTYQRSGLALLENSNCFMDIANTKFKNFNNETANLGSSVLFDLPSRFTTAQGLVASFQAANQRTLSLTCDQAVNTSYEFTAQDRIFNVEAPNGDGYMDLYGRSAIAEMGSNIEANLALNANSHCPVNTVVSGQTVPTGALHTESGPYRFFGNGSVPINSYQQLSQMITNFKNYGAVKTGIKVILPDTIIPAIVGTGLNQFAPKRNDEIASSWEVGSFGTPPVMYYQSNLLPIHSAGNVGNGSQTLTVVSTNDPTGANITQITFSGATASDADAIKSGDLIQFNDGVSGQENIRYLTFIGHVKSAQAVQVRSISDVAATGGGQVTITITPALQSTAGATQNISRNIVAGMQASVLPDHQCGLVIGGDSFYLAMPKLPDQFPYASSSEYDEDTGVSMRLTYGSLFGQNQMGIIHDATWGSVLVPEYSMRIAFPVM